MLVSLFPEVSGFLNEYFTLLSACMGTLASVGREQQQHFEQDLCSLGLIYTELVFVLGSVVFIFWVRSSSFFSLGRLNFFG